MHVSLNGRGQLLVLHVYVCVSICLCLHVCVEGGGSGVDDKKMLERERMSE